MKEFFVSKKPKVESFGKENSKFIEVPTPKSSILEFSINSELYKVLRNDASLSYADRIMCYFE